MKTISIKSDFKKAPLLIPPKNEKVAGFLRLFPKKFLKMLKFFVLMRF